MPRIAVATALAFSFVLSAQTQFLPIKQIHAGMHGVGRTVFSGSQISDFDVEILGVLENVGPKESLIIARLSGGPLEHTGVMQGMSGSPVYIDGKLIGAVAMAFPFSKDPIAGIRPIEDMLQVAPPVTPQPAPSHRQLALAERDLTRGISRPQSAMAGDARMVNIATPVSFGGFTAATLDAFAPQLRALGLEPRQGISAGSETKPTMGNPADVKPGSMISVQLMAGDMGMGADGTVTYVDGSHLYAFGHRFLDVGATSLPFARADVITLMPNVNTSFKLSTAREWMGSISQDRSTAISGELGVRPPMVPMSLAVTRSSKAVEKYQMQMVNDPLLSPLLLQMAVFSVIDRTERTMGAATLRVTGELDFQNAPAPVRLDNLYSADNGTAAQVSLNTAIPAAYILQSGFNSVKLSKVSINVEAFDEKRQFNIDGVTLSKRQVHPGDKLQIAVLLTGENGAETTRTVDYQVPIGAQPGQLYFTVSDASVANLIDFRQILQASPRSPRQLIDIVNELHPNTKAYVRVWRADPAFQLEGTDLPAPPPSIALVLDGAATNLQGVTSSRNSKLAEMEIDGAGVVISGSKTVQVEVKE
ncbi:MAG TPA: SpoIVB peptidase S55 domain-containing protein [Bryobacteraceae bacterium]|nr:SpoIVB peptidase S55 domain-containing protein [Bryobacteraceae bacterium]